MKYFPRKKTMAYRRRRLVALLTVLGVFVLSYHLRADEMIDPERYLVGPGDKFTIEFFDAKLQPIKFTISIEGNATISNVGSFQVAGMTLSQAKSKLQTGLRTRYSGAKFSIVLTSVRKKRVSVAGAVESPGLYDDAASTLASQVLSAAGGLLPGASRRNITLRNANGDVIVDLVRFWRLGDFDANPPIYLGDVLFVPLHSDTTTSLFVSGEVRRPGRIEYTGRDNLSDLIDLAGGLTGSAKADSVMVFSGANGRSKGTLMPLASAFLPGHGARIVVLSAEIRPDPDDITVSGYARSSGRFPFIAGMTLTDALALSGGVRDDAYQPGITVFNIRLDRRGASETLNSLETVSLERADFPVYMAPYGSAQVRTRETYDFRKNSIRDIPLTPGDSIFVPRAEGFVSVLGQVADPGLVSFSDGLSSSNLINRAGGLTVWADRSRSYVTRRVGGGSTPLSGAGRIYDGDIIYVARKVTKGGGFLGSLRDVSLIGAGIALTALAIDRLAE